MATSFDSPDDSRCRYCGGKLSLLQRVSRQEFCSSEHRREYQREQEEMALARLQHASAPVVVQESRVLRVAEEPVEVEAPLLEPEPAEVAWDVANAEEDGPAEDEASPLYAPTVPMYPDAVAAQAPCAVETPALETDAREWIALPSVEASIGNNWQPSKGNAKLDHLVAVAAGDVLTILAVVPHAEDRDAGCGLPVLQPDDTQWREIRAREAGRRHEPPMAGLVRLPGPQTLRIVVPISRPEAEPEAPLASPNTRVPLERQARTAGPKMGGMRAMRTRFGSSGSLRPRNEAEPEPMASCIQVSPAMPKMQIQGTPGKAASGVGTGQGAGAGAGAGEGEGAGQPGDKGGSDLTIEAWMLPKAGLQSLGGGPLDVPMAAAGCPGGITPFDVAATRRLLAGLWTGRVAVPLPLTQDASMSRAEAAEGALLTAPAPGITAVSLSPGPCLLDAAAQVPGHRIVGAIAARPGWRRPRQVPLHAERSTTSRPAVRPVALRMPSLPNCGCVAGVRTRDWEAPPRLDIEAEVPVAASGLVAPRVTVKRRGRLGTGSVQPLPFRGCSPQPGTPASALFARPGRADDYGEAKKALHIILCSGSGLGPRAVVPRVRTRLEPALIAMPAGVPLLDPATCAFASGGALWDSLI